MYPNKKYDFETGVYRPPSEGGASSLLVRLTRNCPWNHCTFCAMYKREKFSLRKPDEIIGDINVMHDIYSQIEKISQEMGFEGEIHSAAVSQFLKAEPDLYYHSGVSMLLNWILAGGKTVFLQDADSLIMKTDQIVSVLQHLKSAFPSIERITSYARSRTIVKKPTHDLIKILNSGLDRLHIGLETGDDKLLKIVKKGTTPEDHIKAGQKALKAGFQVSEYWMPGLGGTHHSWNHAKNSAEVLNKINPHYIRSRSFTPRPGTLYFEQASKNKLDRQTPAEQLHEIKLMLENLTVTSKICFDHAGNHWKKADGRLLLNQSYEGYKFPEEKDRLLDLLETGIEIHN
jgi:radical SAM superfamily enzyme YgiQ (UPF0313 family)